MSAGQVAGGGRNLFHYSEDRTQLKCVPASRNEADFDTREATFQSMTRQTRIGILTPCVYSSKRLLDERFRDANNHPLLLAGCMPPQKHSSVGVEQSGGSG